MPPSHTCVDRPNLPCDACLQALEKVECFECFKEVPISQTEECNCWQRVCKGCMPAHEKHERETHEPDTSRRDWEAAQR